MAMQPTRDSEKLRSLDDPRLLASLEQNTTGAYADCARNIPGEVEISPVMTRYICGAPVSLFNGVGLAQITPEHLDAQIEAALQPFKERDLPMQWWVGPSSRPANLGARLSAHGLADAGSLPGMALDLSAMRQTSAPPAALTIIPATTRETLEEWVQVVVPGFGMPQHLIPMLFEMSVRQTIRSDPQWVYFLGRLDDRPVATSALFLSAGVAGVYCVTTLPEARRCGIGAEMTRAALQHAIAQGYGVSILQPSQMGFPIYEALGFRTVLTFHIFAWPA